MKKDREKLAIIGPAIFLGVSTILIAALGGFFSAKNGASNDSAVDFVVPQSITSMSPASPVHHAGEEVAEDSDVQRRLEEVGYTMEGGSPIGFDVR